MTDKKTSYLEKQLEAALKFEQDKIVITFQREKIKLANELEITLLQENNPFIEKNITLTEDELIFTYKKEPNFMTFGKLRTLDERSRWMFASKVLRFIMLHQSNRLHLIVCPENILIDESLTAYFLHYGVKESIPPYERNKERLWAETKAIIAAAVQPKYKSGGSKNNGSERRTRTFDHHPRSAAAAGKRREKIYKNCKNKMGLGEV